MTKSFKIRSKSPCIKREIAKRRLMWAVRAFRRENGTTIKTVINENPRP